MPSHSSMSSHLAHGASPYLRLLAMVLLSFASMYVLMYAMVDSLANVIPNFNQFYMAGLMTAPMVLIELALMGGMYPNKKRNAAISVASLVVFILCWTGIRHQTAIGDEQFLKSMIPHHAGAVLMCGNAPIEDPEIKALCDGIITGQQAEIDKMKGILERMR